MVWDVIMDNEGFFFVFDEEEEGGKKASDDNISEVRWGPPQHRTREFPWQSLSDTAVMEVWLSRYPTATSSPPTTAAEGGRCARGSGTGPSSRPLSLEVPPFCLAFQSPPRDVDNLLTRPHPDGAPPPPSSSLAFSPPQEPFENGKGDEKNAHHHLDIVPGKYYGGLKVWSCAPDLARYLVSHAREIRPLLEKGVVAEVGCGQALPGLAALCLGASHLLLQDYNVEVLDACAAPNVAATVKANASTGPVSMGAAAVKLIHGDWVDLEWSEAGAAGCDVILGSDVTFDKEACDKLALLLHRWLTPKTGIALLGSKEYYFGTNGGRVELMDSLAPYHLEVETLEHVKDGGSMDRVILKVKFE